MAGLLLTIIRLVPVVLHTAIAAQFKSQDSLKHSSHLDFQRSISTMPPSQNPLVHAPPNQFFRLRTLFGQELEYKL